MNSPQPKTIVQRAVGGRLGHGPLSSVSGMPRACTARERGLVLLACLNESTRGTKPPAVSGFFVSWQAMTASPPSSPAASSTHTEWMRRALQLAAAGLYTTTPNPRVGCVLVRDGQVVGEGAHLKAGEPHAEVHALRMAGEAARGATAYVTLEPCSHTGRTPPCADALLAAGIQQVVVAMQDPNPLVAGQGIARLRAQGLTVTVGVCAAEAQALNPGFIKRMTKQQPFVRLKLAASLDGRTALSNGVSQWITGAPARADVHHWRAQSCAIVTGIETILHDNAALTVREVQTPRQPLRVVLDSQLRIPLDARVLHAGHTLVAYAHADPAKVHALQAQGVQTVALPGPTGRVDLSALLHTLNALPINELMVEAGPTLSGAFMQAGCVDEYLLYYAPKLMGHTGREMFSLPEWRQIQDVPHLHIKEVRQIGQDIRLLAQPCLPPEPGAPELP